MHFLLFEMINTFAKTEQQEDQFAPWKSWFALTSIQKFDSMGQLMSPRSQKVKPTTFRIYCKDFQTRTFKFETTEYVISEHIHTHKVKRKKENRKNESVRIKSLYLT
jgi:hypothetical protein